VETTPGILNLDTGWKCMVIFVIRELLLWGKSPLYPFERRLGRSRVVLDMVMERNIFPRRISNPDSSVIQPV
jgi:hypothetical protein